LRGPEARSRAQREGANALCCAARVVVTEADAARGVAVAVFTCAAWGRRRRRVAVNAAHVSRSRVRRVGSRLWSSRAWRGAAVAVDAARVSRSRALRPVGCGGGCGAWGRRRRLRARGVAVAVFARVGSPSPSSRVRGRRRRLRARGVGSSPSMRRVCRGRGLRACHRRGCGASGRGRGLPPLRRVRRGCRLCAACGVAVALFAPRGVSPVPSLRQVWCCGGRKRGGDGAARRDAATWRSQLGRARRGGGMPASSLWLVMIGRVYLDNFLLNVALSSPHDRVMTKRSCGDDKATFNKKLSK